MSNTVDKISFTANRILFNSERFWGTGPWKFHYSWQIKIHLILKTKLNFVKYFNLCVFKGYKQLEDNWWESGFSSYLVGPSNQSQDVGVGIRHIYPLIHLTNPKIKLFKWLCWLKPLISVPRRQRHDDPEVYRKTLSQKKQISIKPRINTQ